MRAAYWAKNRSRYSKQPILNRVLLQRWRDTSAVAIPAPCFIGMAMICDLTLRLSVGVTA
jgi:hypothetical protein